MGRPFSSKEARSIISEHRNVLNQLDGINDLLQISRETIRDHSERMVAENVTKILRDIPIEEINNSSKHSFRIKTLRDHGYHTVADLTTVTESTLSSIHGISQDAAYAIKRVANNIVSQAGKGCKIRLSTDNQTKEASALILSIYRHKRYQRLADLIQTITNEHRSALSDAINDLGSSCGTLKWFFASKTKKQKATEAFLYLIELMAGSYGENALSIIDEIESVQNCLSTEAWDDFAANSIQYFNILEEIYPGILGNDDALYGLPEELAREIQDECFFPEGLLCELRRYQEWGVKYILHQERVLLGDEMGLGKTIQAIASMVSLKNTGAEHFLVICPASVITNWCREIQKMSRLTVTKIHGGERLSALKAWLAAGGVAVTTFETTAYCSLPESFRLSMVVVDEAHYIKNPEAKRTMNVKKICARSERLLFMTGTALENKVEEMISLISILQPNISLQIKNMTYLSAAPQFRKMVAPVYYRRKREDVLTELPELIESKEWCTMGKKEEAEYEYAVLSKNYAEARRVSWNVSDLKDSSKASRLLELIDEAKADGRKVIVFSFFLDTIRKISLLLGECCTDPINGSVTLQRRQEIIDEFDHSPPGTVLAAQLQSGGTGLNIQSASVVILCEPQFKPSIENQAISRAYRMGQTRNVLVYRLLCENTVDEKIMTLLADKQAVFDAFADQSEAANQSKEIDEHTFGNIIKEEIERINLKNGR